MLSKADTFTTPALFLTGSADLIVSVNGVHKFFKECASQDKTYITLRGWYHELLNEPLNHLLMPVITDWLKQRIALKDEEVLQVNVDSEAVDPAADSAEQRLIITPIQ